MMKAALTTLLGASLLAPALVPTVSADDLAGQYFSAESNPQLTPQEQQALAIAKQWQSGSTQRGSRARPFTGRDGSIVFVFGMQQASIVCAVLQVCDIALQPGEQVNSIQLGDTARWNVEPAESGSGINRIEHVMVKPLDVGLSTSLVIATDRRTYHLRLRSHLSDYMPVVSFSYPDEVLAKWNRIEARQRQEREDNTLPVTGEYLGNLSFDYSISGRAPWKPVRVYNDGRKTIIEMPKIMEQTDAPSLLVVRGKGGLLTKAQTVMVNYRVQSDRYIVDMLFDKAILISGVGSRQERVTITRNGGQH